MSQKIQIKRASTAPATVSLWPGELAIGGKKVFIGVKLDDAAPGSETQGAAIRLLNEEDYSSLANIAQGMTKAYVVATTPTSLTTGSITTIDNKTIALSSLKIGDYVIVKATGVPDYFWDGTALSPIEIDKSLLDGYLTEALADTKYLQKSTAASTYATKAEHDSTKTTLENRIATKLDKSEVTKGIPGTRACSYSGIVAQPGTFPPTPDFGAGSILSAISDWKSVRYKVSGVLPNQTITMEGNLPATEGLLCPPTWYDLSYVFAQAIFACDVVDDLTTGGDFKPLSATQGKKLSTRINTVESNLTTEINKKISTSSIVNNLTSTSTTTPLSAAQGKVLNDSVVALSNNVNNLVELIDGGIWTA